MAVVCSKPKTLNLDVDGGLDLGEFNSVGSAKPQGAVTFIATATAS